MVELYTHSPCLHCILHYEAQGTFYLYVFTSVRWVSRHHGKACPQVADVGNCLQIWKVAMNVLNKKSRTAYEMHPPPPGLGGCREAKNS
jgi:hypothetical protein